MRNTKTAIFALCLGCACAALLWAEGPARGSGRDADHVAWVEGCLKDFETVKVGMTRGEIEAKLAKDGGLQGVSPVRFAHPACGYFKIDVEFDHKRDVTDQNRAVQSKDDRAKRVSRPYIERPFLD